MKRLLLMWLGEIKGHRSIWNQRDRIGISKFLTKCNEMRPSEIHRSIRTLDCIKYWKATEFRTFLLYIGIVALKDRVSERAYEMFLRLFSAVTICSSNAYAAYLPVARDLFVDFIEMHIELYGESSITMNIHNTSHVVDDVELFGPLDTISAYKFENHLHHIKIKLKQCNRPLQQIARRIIEVSYSEKITHSIQEKKFPILKNQVIFPDGTIAYKCIEYKPNVIFSSAKEKEKDKWILTLTNQIIEFEYVATDAQKKIMIRGSTLKNVRNFFDNIPFDSSMLNIFLSNREKFEPQNYDPQSIKAKLFCLPFKSEYVFLPLLHSL